MIRIIREKVAFTCHRNVVACQLRTNVSCAHVRTLTNSTHASAMCDDAKHDDVAHHSSLSQTFQLSVMCMLLRIELFGESR